MCLCLGTNRKRSKAEYQGVQSARNPTSTEQFLTTETEVQEWQEQPYTAHQTITILPRVSAESPLHFLQGPGAVQRLQFSTRPLLMGGKRNSKHSTKT